MKLNCLLGEDGSEIGLSFENQRSQPIPPAVRVKPATARTDGYSTNFTCHGHCSRANRNGCGHTSFLLPCEGSKEAALRYHV